VKKPAQGKKLRGNRNMKKSGGGPKLGFFMVFARKMARGEDLTKAQSQQYCDMGRAAGHDMAEWL
jgi:hypothetical protein